MRASLVPCSHLLLASSNSAVVRLCSGNGEAPVPNVAHVRSTSWSSQARALFSILFFALVAFPAPAFAAPWTLGRGVYEVIKRQSAGSQNSQSNGGINMTVWLPILLVTVVFILFSFITCIRRRAAAYAVARNVTAANRAGSNPVGGNTARTRRRPQRTPSQISTRSLPPYMKEPGDQELVLFRGTSDMADMDEDEPAPPPAMPTLAEDDDERNEMRGAMFDIALGRIESVDTIPDASTANLIRRASASMPRPPELGHPAISQDHQSRDGHSLDSAGSEAELLATHQRRASVDNNAVPMGEAPSYSEAVSAEGEMTAISLNDPEPNSISSNAAVPHTLAPSHGRPRLSFLLQNPFSSRDNASSTHPHDSQSIRSESPAQHARSGSALSRFSTRDSHESHHSRTPSRSILSRSRSGSNSNLLRAFRSHSPGLHAGSSTISLDSISAPLTHTATRAEFYAPKGGLLTAEQIKLITSREALERFGVPYGPDAVAAYSLSRERSEPPPDFESVAGEHREQPGRSGSGSNATDATAQRTEAVDAATGLPHSTSPSQPSPSQGGNERAGSRASTDISHEMAPKSGGQAQVVQMGCEGETDGVDEPRTTAQPMTPGPARPLSIYRDHGRS